MDNFLSFYDWGFLDAGQFYNIHIPQSGIYGGDRHKLRVASTPNYASGKVWEGYRQNWVWESGIDGTTEQPTTISGVFVDDTFYATGNTTKPFYVDYPNGRVVFDNALPLEIILEGNTKFGEPPSKRDPPGRCNNIRPHILTPLPTVLDFSSSSSSWANP